MKKLYKVILSIALVIGASQYSFASHVSGGDISYENIGPSQFRITLKLFRDCSGIDMIYSAPVTFVSNCGGSFNVSLPLIDPSTGLACSLSPVTACSTEISQLCAAMQDSSTCHPGGTRPGMQMYTYQGLVTFPNQCDHWTISYLLSARNCTTNLNPCSPDFYIEATLYSQTNDHNNSPNFTAQPIPYVCAGQLVNYNYGVIEVDGDSLVYSLDTAQQALNSNCGYGGSYTAQQPISPVGGTTINPLTGQLVFTPDLIGDFVIVVRVDEYDHVTHAHKGSVIRDIEFIVQNCMNHVPDPSDGAIVMTSGNATQTGPHSITMCEGQNFCFNAVFHDSDLIDTLNVLSNVTLALPGSTISHFGTNPMTVHVCWTAPAGSALSNSNFSLVVRDNACPVTGLQTFVYTVFVSASTLAGPDTTICGSMVAALQATGGSHFTWTALPGGDPIVIGVNFSDSTIANPIATPDSTTSYVVVSDLVGVCGNTDTVTVFVTNTFNHTISQSAGNLCLGQSVQLSIDATSPGTFTYIWDHGSNLNDSVIHNPIATFSNPGTYHYHVVMTNSLGCTTIDSVAIVVAANYPPPAVATAAQNIFCKGDSTQLDIIWGPGIPPVCDTTATACSGPFAFHDIGAVNDSAEFPGPFMGQFEDGRIQMLVTAAEMNASGFLGGKINSLIMKVTQKNSTAPYQNFTVHMGSTALTDVNASFEPTPSGLVFGPANFSTTLGYNTITFDTPFLWNGACDLLFEICYNNPNGSGPGGLDKVQLTNTTNMSTNIAQGNANVGCNMAVTIPQYNARPHVKFGICSYPLDLSALTIRWRSGLNVADSTIANPYSRDTITTLHTMVVSSSITGCVTTDTINLTVSNPATNAGSDISICAGTSTTLTGTSAVGGITFSWSPTTDLSNATVLHPVIPNLTGTRQYVLQVTDAAGCHASDSLIATLNQLPVASFTGLDTIYCSSSGPVWLHGSPAYGLPPALPHGIFTGPLGAINDSTFSPNPGIVGLDTIHYVYTDANGCVDDTIHITHVYSFPVSFTPNGGAYCPDAPDVALTGAPSGGVFSGVGVTDSTFHPSVAGSGHHNITYTAQSACGQGQYTASIYVRILPSVIVSNLNSEYCTSHAPVTLNPVPPGGAFTVDGTAIPGDLLTLSGLTTGSHSLKYVFTDNDSVPPLPACAVDTTLSFTINALPIVDAGPDITICAGTSANLNATGTPPFAWLPPFGVSDPTIANPVVSPTSNATYIVYSGPTGCQGTDNVNVFVLDNPTVEITATPVRGTRPLSVVFSSTVTDGSFYSWTFGDGESSSDEHPSHIYHTGGTDTVKLVVENFNHQCSAWDTLLIIVDDSVKLKTYNIFTPNGDGVNDNFIVKNEGLESIDVEIFNRWGKKVGEYHDLNGGWDGKIMNGKIADDGVYYYVAKAKGLDGKEYNVSNDPDLKGFVQLIRNK